KVDEIMLCSLNINKQAGYIYQQIYQHIKQAILNNQLQAYGKLPSKRKLSEQLGVSVNSVTSAYEQLVAEGYIYTKEKQGYYVVAIVSLKDTDIEVEELPEHLIAEIADNSGWLSFPHMTSDVSLLPMNEWLKAQRQAMTKRRSELS